MTKPALCLPLLLLAATLLSAQTDPLAPTLGVKSGAPGDRSSLGWTRARNPLHAVLGRGPLAFYGRISYGMYMTHIMAFIYFGWFDRKMDAYGTAGNLAVVVFRLAVATVVATVLWYGFESRILKLKRLFA